VIEKIAAGDELRYRCSVSAPERPLPAAAIAALANGNKIEAIKIVRQEWGIDLRESKDAVEAYAKGGPDQMAASQQAGSRAKAWLWLFVLVALAVAAYYFLR
jgi:ribosomal protein L7/L12